MRYYFAVVRKEATVLVVRRPLRMVFLILTPAILALLAGFAFARVLGSPARLPVAVVDLDASPQSRALAGDIAAVPGLRVTRETQTGVPFSEADAVALIDHGRRPAIVVIPSGYGAALDAGRPITLPLYSDPAQPAPAAAVQSVVSAALDRVAFTHAATTIAVSLRPGDASVPGNVQRGVDGFLASPPVSFAPTPVQAASGFPSPWEQTIPGFAVLFSARLGSMVWIPTDDERRVYGIGRRLDSLRAARWWQLAGKFTVAFAYGFVQFAVLFVVAHFIFGMRLGSLPALAVMIAAFLLLPLSVGVAISGFFRSHRSALTFNEAWGTLLPILGGALVPLALLPSLLRAVGRFTPYYWGLVGMQDVMVRGASVASEWKPLLIVVGASALLLLIFAPRFSYRSGEAA
jgi:ABC-2 type transport system permease protein